MSRVVRSSGMSVRTRRWSVVVGALALSTGVAACSDDEVSTPTTIGQVCASEQPALQADAIAAAITAVEAERSGPQRYYEINATERLVNLFVVGDVGGQVVPYVYLGGELSVDAPSTGASGNTFAATSLDFDPTKVTSCVRAQLSDASLQVFTILGGPGETVQYQLIAQSDVGGTLVAIVDRSGAILSVETEGESGPPSS